MTAQEIVDHLKSLPIGSSCVAYCENPMFATNVPGEVVKVTRTEECVYDWLAEHAWFGDIE